MYSVKINVFILATELSDIKRYKHNKRKKKIQTKEQQKKEMLATIIVELLSGIHGMESNINRYEQNEIYANGSFFSKHCFCYATWNRDYVQFVPSFIQHNIVKWCGKF